MIFDEKANQGVSEKKKKDMSVSYRVYTSKIHRRI